MTKQDSLYLVDGGEDGQEIPFIPLLQKECDLQVMFILDSSVDTPDNWSDGFPLAATYERRFGEMGKNIEFPPVSDLKTFEEN